MPRTYKDYQIIKDYAGCYRINLNGGARWILIKKAFPGSAYPWVAEVRSVYGFEGNLGTNTRTLNEAIREIVDNLESGRLTFRPIEW